ncbi:MAG TPA: thioredoxin family protein [Puia sp.]|uniref:thioredoxin family protein n=1 Tax=Puia sp. TaxID=2045100 RepID=UPI002BD97C89|nr:thioredoxin family protein [Puia sp.]HVU94444.1 thioredoxin family protein [Puia sp.]
MPQKNYENPLTAEPRFRLIHFRTEWNGACQIVAMMIGNLIETYAGRVEFDTADIDRDPAFAAAYGITEVPTVLLLKGGEVIEHAVGMISRQELVDKIERSLSGS